MRNLNISENNLTVKELIEQLKKVDENLPVIVYVVGVTAKDSFSYPLEFEDDTVDVFDGKCRIAVTYL